MAWIESHQELARHPKTLRLARLLGVSVPAAIGHLQLLWWWAMDFASDGSLADFEAEEIATAVMWDGDPDVLVAALLAAKFVDGGPGAYEIHDWHDYAGRLVTRRQANAERMRNARSHNVQRTSGARAGATVPDLTVPDLTVPDLPPNPPPQAEGGLAPRGRRRRREDPDAIVEPLTPRDEQLWQAAVSQMRPPGVRRDLFTGLIEPLVPLGRTADGGLRLRAPPNVAADAQRMMTRVVTRILEEVGDEAGSAAAIVG